MSKEQNKPIDDFIKEVEIKRINAETARIEEERQKINLERRELERTINLPWFRKRQFFQAVVAGLVAIPLIWFYFTEIVIPLHNTSNIEQGLRLAVLQDSLSRVQKNFERKTEELQRNYAILDSSREQLAQEYKKLSMQLTLTEHQRDAFKQKYETIIKPKYVKIKYASRYPYGIAFEVEGEKYEFKPEDEVIRVNLIGDNADLWLWECPSEGCRWSQFDIIAGQTYRIVDSGNGRGLKLIK